MLSFLEVNFWGQVIDMLQMGADNREGKTDPRESTETDLTTSSKWGPTERRTEVGELGAT